MMMYLSSSRGMFAQIATVVLFLVLHADVGEAVVRGRQETSSATESETPDLFGGGDSLSSWENLRVGKNKDVSAFEELPFANEVMLEELNVGRVLRKKKGKKKKTKAPTRRPTRAPRRTRRPQGSQRGHRVLEQLLESNFADLDQD